MQCSAQSRQHLSFVDFDTSGPENTLDTFENVEMIIGAKDPSARTHASREFDTLRVPNLCD